MKRFESGPARLALHVAGIALLALAWAAGHLLASAGAGHAGHEPARVYLLALLIFVLASAGTALTVMGQTLFARIAISRLWLSHVPAGFGGVRERDQDEV